VIALLSENTQLSFKSHSPLIEKRMAFFGILTKQIYVDCEYIHKVMARSGVTLWLLWHEDAEACRHSLEIPYSFRQFCRFYHSFATVSKNSSENL
jgi:hypothetical protein